ncbi:MAG: polymerase subunit delta [Haloplasmataceae bacterium]|jgi:DNA polymerase-3 subunit delta|nr:polymerase subunit delta [Haloplasmataceae bacterium]
MKNIILFLGANKYQIEYEINNLIKQLKGDDLSLSKYDNDEFSLDDILNDCETIPFLSEQKVVIVNNPIFFSNEKSKLEQNIDRFTKYINNPNETTILIINASNITVDKRKKVYKDLMQLADVRTNDNINEQEAGILIRNRLKHISITFEAVNELINRTECDVLKLNSELEKISFYIDDKNEITIEDIKLLVSEPYENNVFNLTNNLLERNIEKAISVYKKLLTQNEEPIVFSAIMAKNFHNLYIIKQYQKKGISEYKLKDILKIHSFQLKKLYQIATRLKEEDLKKNILLLHKYDIEVKTGKVDKYLGFELLILQL